jgi:GTPase SAR1 family protein
MSQKPEIDPPPSGFRLRSSFVPPPFYTIGEIAWSSDGQKLAVAYNSHYIAILHPQTGQILHNIKTFRDDKEALARHNSISWSPDGQVMAACSTYSFEIWNVTTGQRLYLFEQGRDKVSWSPDGTLIAACRTGNVIDLRDARTGAILRTLSFNMPVEGSIFHMAWSPRNPGHIATVSANHSIRVWDVEKAQTLYFMPGTKATDGWGLPSPSNITWSPDGRVLAWGENTAIQLWDIQTNQISSLEGHTARIVYLAFSPDGSLLATKAGDDTIRFWHNLTRETIAILTSSIDEGSSRILGGPNPMFAFSPRVPAFADIDRIGKVSIWDLDLKTIFAHVPPVPTVHYCNAKVVLLGESGAGKSGLALTLTGQPFVPTVSTHGRSVSLLDSQDVDIGGGRNMTCETPLWDLAGQPGYRLIHQLHLNEVAVALVVFDVRNETDPFAGVYHWHRALEQAQRVQGNMAPPVRKLLVAARTDRGGIGVSRERIDALLKELNFDGYFETSAKEGWGIAELKQAILAAIPWQQLPQVSSTKLFQQIKDFLLVEKESGRLQPTSEDLYRTFLRSKDAPRHVADLQAQFETCIGRVESRGLIRRLSFGKLVLLQPEKLDAYASALVNAVKEEPDGLGSIAEEHVLQGHFTMPQDERISDKQQEKVLLIAMAEDLLSHEIVLREQADDGPHLVFPSQSTRENPDLPDPEGKAVIFSFEGPVLNIYATLTVRLSQ